MCHKAISELVKGVSKDMVHAGNKTTSDTLKLRHWLKMENQSYIIYNVLWITGEERTKILSNQFFHCTHALCKQHIPHMTNFGKLINLAISCSGKDLEVLVCSAAKNAFYPSSDAITDFMEAIEVCVISANRSASWCSIFQCMAAECTDIATVEELSLFCRWVENGSPVEQFMGILPLKKANAESFYSAQMAQEED